MMNAAADAYFLADQTKFGRNAPLRWKPMAQARAVISDAAPDAGILQRLEALGLSLNLPQHA